MAVIKEAATVAKEPIAMAAAKEATAVATAKEKEQRWQQNIEKARALQTSCEALREAFTREAKAHAAAKRKAHATTKRKAKNKGVWDCTGN